MIEKLDRYHDGTIEIIDKINEIIDFLNDTYLMKVKDGDCISCSNVLEDIPFVTGLCTAEDLTVTTEAVTTCTNPDVKCPHCGESYYTVLYSDSTCVYYPPIYKDGVNINPDHNTTTTHCQCMNCGKEFKI